jgi:hypothetical protein
VQLYKKIVPKIWFCNLSKTLWENNHTSNGSSEMASKNIEMLPHQHFFLSILHSSSHGHGQNSIISSPRGRCEEGQHPAHGEVKRAPAAYAAWTSLP